MKATIKRLQLVLSIRSIALVLVAIFAIAISMAGMNTKQPTQSSTQTFSIDSPEGRAIHQQMMQFQMMQQAGNAKSQHRSN